MARRAGWAAVSAASGLLLGSFFLHPLGPAAGSLLAALAICTAFRPSQSLLWLAALAPLATILFIVLDVQADGVRLVEGLTLAYLTGWAARRIADPVTGLPPAFIWSVSALVAAAVASGAVSAARHFTQQAGSAPWSAIADWFRSYAIHLDATTFALLFAQGPLLTLAVASVCRTEPERRPAVTRMMVVGAAAAALLNVSRLLIDGALFRDEPLHRFVNLLMTLRVNVHHGDLNAAGSYFALAWFLALGLTTRDRFLGTVCLLLTTAGLWVTGSRVAILATLVVAALSLLYRFGARLRKGVLAMALLVTLGALSLALWKFPPQRHVSDPSLALRIRMGLASGAIAMSADHPVFGVGLGHFYDQSQRYVHVPNYIVRENAHNNFLQVLAELGLPGLWLFLSVSGLSLSAMRVGDGAATWPIAAGIAAYLLTCLGGHPLLVPLAAVPFWMALGLAAANGVPPPHPLLRMIAGLLIAMFVVTLPMRIVSAMRSANLEGTSFGLSAWQRLDDGERFRWAGGRATFYVASSSRVITIPLQTGPDAPPAVEVRVVLDGREANRIVLRAGDPWRSLRLILPRRSDGAYARIDLESRLPGAESLLPGDPSAEGGILMVGRPRVEP